MWNFIDKFKYVPELMLLLKKNASFDAIQNWMDKRGYRYSHVALKNTFKKAGRDDLISYFIKEEDIKEGDIVRSRYSSRLGKVISIREVSNALEVQWETGGRQLVPREAVFKVLNRDKLHSFELSDFAKIRERVDFYKEMKE